jgi:hypothetical protein
MLTGQGGLCSAVSQKQMHSTGGRECAAAWEAESVLIGRLLLCRHCRCELQMMSHTAGGDSPCLQPGAARNTAQARHQVAGTAAPGVQFSLTAAGAGPSEVSASVAGAVCGQTAAAVQRQGQRPRVEVGRVAALLRRP